MDLSQKKLIKEEWELLERPLNDEEIEILKMINKGYNNINIVENKTKSLSNWMKIKNTDILQKYLFDKYFLKRVNSLIDEIDSIKIPKNIKNIDKYKNGKDNLLRNRDKIRIDLMDNKMKDKFQSTTVNIIYEYMILEYCEKIINNMTKKNEKIDRNKVYNKYKNYYILKNLEKMKILDINKYLYNFFENILSITKETISIKSYISCFPSILQETNYIDKFKNIELHNHQKEIFTISQQETSKLIFYQAPTGTGKTLTPLGLVNKYKVIFVCAAKHVGLQLARCCVSMGIPLAIAFGCNDVSDIRLHYSSAKTYIKNYKTGGIFKVDNSDGTKVEIIISDIQSYTYSMYYMNAFNDINNIITFWDEPTITLDYEDLSKTTCLTKNHSIMKNLWNENIIPNFILSSATLPDMKTLKNMVHSFKNKFGYDSIIYEIKSYDLSKDIPLIDINGYNVMPHNYFVNNYSLFKKSIKFLNDNKTMLRYLSLKEMTDFIYYLNDELVDQIIDYIDFFDNNVNNVNIEKIREYYLFLCNNYINKDNYSNYIDNEDKEKIYESQIYITTKDAYTLKNGPTIFLANDVEKVAQVYLKYSNIPSEVMNDIHESITLNEKIRKRIEELNKLIDTIMNKDNKDDDDNKKTKDINRNPEVKQYQKEINQLSLNIKKIQLYDIFIPNRVEHIKRYNNNIEGDEFTSEITDNIVEKIMLLKVDNIWKVLLMMGIGVFSINHNKQYLEIMKELASNQKLYLIIASPDFIYGTNYQFCTEYISKDLEDMSQEKLIQAFGRVGRTKYNKQYSIRLRSNNIIDKILLPEEKLETKNMNILFG
jgi:hypothetical protein